MTPDTGSPRADAQSDFARARRRARSRCCLARLRGEPDDVAMILPFEEVVEALGRARRARARAADDRRSTRSSAPSTARASSTATSARRRRGCASAGRASPPRSAAARRCRRSTSTASATCTSSRDGHHRVSVARAQGLRHDRRVRDRGRHRGSRRRAALRIGELALKSHERLFSERVPLRRRRARASSSPTSGATRRSPRASRRGAFATCRTAASS